MAPTLPCTDAAPSPESESDELRDGAAVREESVRNSCDAGSELPDLEPRACSLRSIAMVRLLFLRVFGLTA